MSIDFGTLTMHQWQSGICQKAVQKAMAMRCACRVSRFVHRAIGYNYRMSNVCAGIGRGQMTVLGDHITHHKHVQALYEELLASVPGVHMHKQPVYCEGSTETAPGVFEGPHMIAYTNGIEEDLFKVGFCLPAGPYVTDDDVRYIVACINFAVVIITSWLFLELVVFSRY